MSVRNGSRIAAARTLLFVPGTRADRLAAALGSAADLVVADLEASVHPDWKDRARRDVASWISRSDAAARTIVRINPVDSAWFEADCSAIAQDTAGVIVPMVTGRQTIEKALARLPMQVPVVALVETAAGILQAQAIAETPGVVRLAFGNMDFATDTRSCGRDSQIFPSAMLVLASRSAGLPPPIAGVTAAHRDFVRLEDDARWERAQGFGAKLCIHPDQLAAVTGVFAPSEQEQEWARRVLVASQSTHVTVVDGQMVDRPVIERARAILREAGQDP